MLGTDGFHLQYNEQRSVEPKKRPTFSISFGIISARRSFKEVGFEAEEEKRTEATTERLRVERPYRRIQLKKGEDRQKTILR